MDIRNPCICGASVKFHRKITSLEGENQSLLDTVQTCNRTALAMRDTIQGLEAENTSLENKVGQLEADKKQLTERLASSEVELHDPETDLHHLQIIFSHMDTAFTRLEALRQKIPAEHDDILKGHPANLYTDVGGVEIQLGLAEVMKMTVQALAGPPE